jgi:DNA-binding NarL/FixJ family response regulator
MNNKDAVAIRVAIVEDDTPFREALEEYLNRAQGFACAGAYGDAREAVRRIPQDAPDVVLVDLRLPGMGGVDCIAELRRQSPGVRAIVLTAFDEDDLVFRSLEAGAYGYLVKRTPPARILDAIREVHAGGSPMSAHIARKVVASFHRATGTALSHQEREVLAGLSRGQTYAAIAQEMGIAIHTVRNYIRRIYEKLHVHSRTEAVARYRGGAGER